MPSPDMLRRQLDRHEKDENDLRVKLAKVEDRRSKNGKEVSRKRKDKNPSRTKTRRINKLESDNNSLAEDAKRLNNKIADASKKAARVRRSIAASERRAKGATATPVIRYVDRVREVPAPVSDKLRVFYAASNPDPAYRKRRIRPEVELNAVRDYIDREELAESIEFRDRQAITFEALEKCLMDYRPHILHFSGHAAGDGSLELDHGDYGSGPGEDVSYDEIARVLAQSGETVRILVLNGCQTLEGAEVFLESVPVVIATSRSITDSEATVFAVNFYASIASGDSVHRAIEESTVAAKAAFARPADFIEHLSRDGINLESLYLVRAGTTLGDLSGLDEGQEENHDEDGDT